MGHLRLGRLPKTQRWNEVVGLLEASPDDIPAVARATVLAAEERLRKLGRDPSVIYCFWLLVRLTWAARNEDFVGALSRLGLEAAHTGSALSFISQISSRNQLELAAHLESGPFSELASLALRRALTETVAQQPASLFGSSVENLHWAFRVYSTRAQFGLLAKRFFGDFLSRTLRFFLDKELANCIGRSEGLSSMDSNQEFMRAMDMHARQSARIVEEFAGGWYSKHNWEAKGEISQDEAAAFVAFALRKLRSELKREAG